MATSIHVSRLLRTRFASRAPCHPSICLVLVFSLRPGAHQHLHSFPTRRSSDLPQAPHLAMLLQRADAPATTSAGRLFDAEIGRHTSELQSPCNLVCRLLLEKKINKLCNREPIKLFRTDNTLILVSESRMTSDYV